MPLAITQMFGRRVLVRRDREAAQSAAGVHVPDQAREYLNTGTVVYSGIGMPGRIDLPSGEAYTSALRLNVDLLTLAGSSFPVGTRVMFFPHEALEVQVDGEALWLVADDAVIATMEEKGDSHDASNGSTTTNA